MKIPSPEDRQELSELMDDCPDAQAWQTSYKFLRGLLELADRGEKATALIVRYGKCRGHSELCINCGADDNCEFCGIENEIEDLAAEIHNETVARAHPAYKPTPTRGA
jgi:hypothetical protein